MEYLKVWKTCFETSNMTNAYNIIFTKILESEIAWNVWL